MSHLLAPRENKRDTRAAQSEPVLKDTSFLAPPQEEKSIPKAQPSLGRRSWLVPPQEEMVNVAALRGEQGKRHMTFTSQYTLNLVVARLDRGSCNLTMLVSVM